MTICTCKLYGTYKAMAVKTTRYWHKNRHIDQCNRFEDPHTSPGPIDNWVLAKRPKMHIGIKISQIVLIKLDIYIQIMKLDPPLSPYSKQNSKWINDFNVRGEKRAYVWFFKHKKGFSEQDLVAQALKPTTDKWVHKTETKRSLCRIEPHHLSEEAAYKIGKTFTSYTSDRGLVSRRDNWRQKSRIKQLI